MTGKIRLLSNDEIDKVRWDSHIKASKNRRIYATSLFLDIFSPRWKAIMLDDGLTVMPLTWNRKFGVTYLFQPVFVQQLGLFYNGSHCMGEFSRVIEDLSLSFRYIDISVNEMNSFETGRHTGFKMSNYLLELGKNYDLIYSEYNKNTRRNLAKAGRLGINITSRYTPVDSLRLFIKNNGRVYSNIRRRDYKRLLSILNKGVDKGIVQIRAARTYTGKIIAAACFLKDFDRYVFYFSANTEMGRKYGAMFFLIDGFIREHSGSRRLLDFNGSVDPGVARFYKGFGAGEVPYHRVRINRLGFPFRYFKQG